MLSVSVPEKFYYLYEQRFDKDYMFMKVFCSADREVFSISWDDVAVLLGSPVVKMLRIR